MSGEESADAALLPPPVEVTAPKDAPIQIDDETKKVQDTELILPDVCRRPTADTGWLSLPYLQSYVYFSLYIALGFAVGSTGPTLELLSKQTNSTMDETGMVFTARGIGWIGGSIFAGAFNIFESDLLSPHRLMLISAASLAAYLLVIPWVTHLWLLLLFALISSVFCAWIDVGANALLFAVWREKVGPWMQALHFFFGVGASLAPAVVALVMKYCAAERQLLISAYILAFLSLFTAVLPALVKSPQVGKAHYCRRGLCTRCRRHREQLWRLDLHLREGKLSHNAEMGGCIVIFCSGRLLAVPLTLRMLNRHLLLLDLLISLPVGIILVASSFVTVLQSKLVLWAMTFLYGLGMASIFATAFSLPSELGLEISTSASSWFIVGGSTGDMAVPAILGFLVVRWSVALAWAVLGCSVALLVLYVGLIASMRRWSADPNPEKMESAEAPIITHEHATVTEPEL